MQRLQYFRPFVENEQPNSSDALPHHSEPLLYDTTAGSVYCEFYGEDYPSPYTLRIIPENDLYQLVFPTGKFIWGTAGALHIHRDMLSSFENGALYDWMCRMMDETSLYYNQLRTTNEGENEEPICTYRVEVREGEVYKLILDKERDIVIVRYPARTVISPPEWFFIQNDGLIGAGNGKVEDQFLKWMREEGFNMKAILNSRREAMKKIDYNRLKEE